MKWTKGGVRKGSGGKRGMGRLMLLIAGFGIFKSVSTASSTSL
jgi:hypothetical protein